MACYSASLLCVATALAIQSPAVANEGNDAINAASAETATSDPHRLTMAIDGNAAGDVAESSAGDGSGPLDSPMAHVVAATYAEMGRALDMAAMARQAAFDAVTSGAATGSFGWQPTSERMARFHFSDPIAVIPLVVFSDAYVALDPASASDLSGRTLCQPAGTLPPDDLRRLIDQGGLRQQPANDFETCVQLVHDGRTDFFVAGVHEGTAVLEELGLAEEFHVAVENPVGLETLHLMVPRSVAGGRAIIADFDAALAELADNGSIDDLLGDGMLAAIPDR